jgi:prepilin-type N-terminal cleavage/methylation domain-containing protein
MRATRAAAQEGNSLTPPGSNRFKRVAPAPSPGRFFARLPFAMRRLSAFTLIELLIVVAIIAILAAIAVPNFLEAQVRSKVSRAQSDLRTIATGVESYFVDYNSYPPGNFDPTDPTNSLPNKYDLIFPRVDRLKPITTPIAYLSVLPLDPFLLGTRSLLTTGTRPVQPADNHVYSFWPPAHANAHRLGGAFNTPELFRDVPNESVMYGRYVLTSAGPDEIVEAPDHMDPGAILALYDPTNGTISVGEIWRFGP